MVAVCESRCEQRPLRILDPFSGTGSSVAVARQLGHEAIGVELSYLGALIGRTRLFPLGDIKSTLEFVDEAAARRCRTWYYPVDPQLLTWIGAENGKFLSYYLMLLEGITDEAERNWLQLAMSSALRSSSVWLPGSIKPQRDPVRIPPDLRKNLKRAARRLAADCELERGTGRGSGMIVQGDATSLPLANESVDAIVTSPPYASMYDYFDVQRLSYLAFSWPVNRDTQIGRESRVTKDGLHFVPPSCMTEWYVDRFQGEDTAEGRSLRLYLTMLERHFFEAFRVVRPQGCVAYAVGNSTRMRLPFPLVRAAKELLRRAGFTEVMTRKRNKTARSILPTGRDPRTGRFSTVLTGQIDERLLYAVRP
jgi:hypothetical protein